MKKVLFITLIILYFSNIKSQLSVTTTLTPTQLVNSVLLGPGVVAFNIQYTGATVAVGYFNGTNSNIGLDSGVILSTGKAISSIGPNNTTSVTTMNNKPGYPQLSQIIGQATKDAAVLEFDFIPSSDTVRFRYVFASDEYYEGVCTPYNDVFAFLISGPGITGTANIALVPGTNNPVSISSVNGGAIGQSIYNASASYSFCNLGYTNFYVDNNSPPGTSVQYDGFTKVFTARSKVIPCQTYHIKLAIADGGNDDTWDSAVFLEAGSFNTRYLSVNNLPKYTACVTNSAAAEGTGMATIEFKRFDSIAYPRTLNYTISGTASPSDYILSSTNINFVPGSDTFNLKIKPLTDHLIEGIETISLTIIPDFIVCNGWTIPGGLVKITDAPDLNPSFKVSDTAGCAPFCIQFNNTTTDTTTALWTFGDGSPQVQSPAVKNCYTKAGVYDVKLEVTNSIGCIDSIMKTNCVRVYDRPFADFIQHPNKQITLSDNKGTFFNSSIGAVSFKWSLDSVYLSSDRNLDYLFKDTGCYVLKLVAYNQNFCSDTTTRNICVKDGFNFWIPNSFSPDEDDINEIFIPKGTDWVETEYSFIIYDRWGKLIFKTNNIDEGWNGKAGELKATDEVYVWRIHIMDIYHERHDYRGKVTLLR